MTEQIYTISQDGRKVGGRYLNAATGKYENADGVCLDKLDLLPSVESEIARLTAIAAQLKAEKEVVADPVVDEGSDNKGAPKNYKARVQWVKDQGRDVPFGVSKEALDVIVADIEANLA